jgi:hypothetical protein
MDDIERLLIRREAFAPDPPDRSGLGSAAFVGQVTSSGANLAVGKFLLVTPVDVTGAESEGGAATFTALSGSVPAYVLGPRVPANGDRILCRRVGHRWVVESGRSAGTGGGPGNIPGCTCQGTPGAVSVTVQYPLGQTAADYGHSFQDSTLRWYYPDPPPYPVAAGAPPWYFSESTWVDDNGLTCTYALVCSGSLYKLAHSATSPLSPGWPTLETPGGPDGGYQNFTIGATSPTFGTNTCSPFNLPFGVAPSGVVLRFRVSG